MYKKVIIGILAGFISGLFSTGGGMIFDRKLNSIYDYMDAIYHHEGKVLTHEGVI